MRSPSLLGVLSASVVLALGLASHPEEAPAVPELDTAVADQERLYSASALLHTHCTHTARKLHASLTHAACTRA